MSNFMVTDVIDFTTVRVNPRWEVTMKNGTTISGDRIKIRELVDSPYDETMFTRLKKLLLDNKNQIQFIAPEVVYGNTADAIVSCNVNIGHSNILYYFPEYVHKD